MDIDIKRKGILVGLLDWLYTEFKDELPSFVRRPTHLALCVANKASPSQRDELKKATKADVEAAIAESRLAAAYAKAGAHKSGATEDAILSRVRIRPDRQRVGQMPRMRYINDVKGSAH